MNRNDRQDSATALAVHFLDLATTGHDPARADAWAGLEQTLQRHGLLALAAADFAEGVPALREAPDPFRTAARKRAIGDLLFHLEATRALRVMGESLLNRGVRYAVLKGPHLQATLYESLGQRAYSDIDILVDRADVPRAVAELAALGYRAPAGIMSRLLRLIHFHLALAAPRGSVPVELHWALADRANLYRLDNAIVLSRVRRPADNGLPALSREDEFLYLAMHIDRHGLWNRQMLSGSNPVSRILHPASCNRLIWFLDLALFLQRQAAALDWDGLWLRMGEWNVSRPVATTLGLLRALCPASGADDALKRLDLEPFLAGGPDGRPDEKWVPAGVNKSVVIRPARLRQLGQLFFPPPDELASFYRIRPTAAMPLVRLAHPVRMLTRLLTP
jgi:hypothetical protein